MSWEKADPISIKGNFFILYSGNSYPKLKDPKTKTKKNQSMMHCRW